jgi:hypothetical protein
LDIFAFGLEEFEFSSKTINFVISLSSIYSKVNGIARAEYSNLQIQYLINEGENDLLAVLRRSSAGSKQGRSGSATTACFNSPYPCFSAVFSFAISYVFFTGCSSSSSKKKSNSESGNEESHDEV